MSAFFHLLLSLSAFAGSCPPPAASGCAGAAPAKTAADGYCYVPFPSDAGMLGVDCLCGSRSARVENSPALKKMLKAFSDNAKTWLPIHSCVRTQEDQELLLREAHCAPQYGDIDCTGRIAEKNSQHTNGIAADFTIPAGGDENAIAHDLCSRLDSARKSANGGYGGISFYGADNGHAFFHMDVLPDWCNWGLCEDALGEGHCKRTKFSKKVALLEEKAAAGRLANAEKEVAELEKKLAALKADCPPGDLSCRDNFQPEANP